MAAAHSRCANLAEYVKSQKLPAEWPAEILWEKVSQTPPLWRCFCVLGTWETLEKMCHDGALQLGGVGFQSGTEILAYRNIILLGYDTPVPYVPNVPKGANAHSASFAHGCEKNAGI